MRVLLLGTAYPLASVLGQLAHPIHTLPGAGSCQLAALRGRGMGKRLTPEVVVVFLFQIAAVWRADTGPKVVLLRN